MGTVTIVRSRTTVQALQKRDDTKTIMNNEIINLAKDSRYLNKW